MHVLLLVYRFHFELQELYIVLTLNLSTCYHWFFHMLGKPNISSRWLAWTRLHFP